MNRWANFGESLRDENEFVALGTRTTWRKTLRDENCYLAPGARTSWRKTYGGMPTDRRLPFDVSAAVIPALLSGMLMMVGACRREAAEPAVPAAWFSNVAAQAGLREPTYCGGSSKDHILESVGSGIAFVDYDSDGLPDIYMVNGWALDEEPSQVRIRGRNRLYHNLGTGRFEDVTDAAGVGDDSWGCGVCAGDFDNDGRIDLFVTNFGSNRLYHNLGRGRFEEVAARAGVDDAGWGAGATFFDADKDGDLDLYVANYIDCTLEDVLAARRTTLWRDRIKVMPGPFGLRGGRDRFYRNNGDGTFHDATDEAGMTDIAEGYGLGVLASDLDDDGDVDVYVANDSNPNFLYRNEGHGTFKEIGSWSGAGVNSAGVAQAGMGLDAADFDGDGLQDLFVTNFARDYSTLYRNVGELFFEDVTAAHAIKTATYAPLSWGCAFLDLDLDADVDLFVLNGHIYPQVDEAPELGESYRQRPLLFRNDAGVFSDVTQAATMNVVVSGRGLAAGDYDNDGDLDLLATAIDEPPLLLRNDVPRRGHWLTVRLVNRHGAYPLNARVTLKTGGSTQVREVRSGSTYASQSSMDLHFGLGSAGRVEELEVRWPDGRRDQHRNIAIDRLIVLREADSPPGGR